MKNQTFALIGNPISGTKSPEIHNSSFKLNGIQAHYEAISVSAQMLGQVIDRLKKEGYGGFNVTLPYKEAVLPFLDEIDPLAEVMGAVNTVKIQSGKLIGFNTDGHGLVAVLERKGICLHQAKIFMIGAGGAAKGIAHALAMAGVKRLHIANRTLEKAQGLKQGLEVYEGIKVTTSPLSDLSAVDFATFNLVIQTTSVGMSPHENEMPIDPKWFGEKTDFCDIVYKPHETLFLRRAKESHHRCLYGLDMLVLQALLAEKHWLGEAIALEETAEKILRQLGC